MSQSISNQNACMAVLLDSPAIRDPLNDAQTPLTPQVGPRARPRKHLEARTRITYPPTHRTRRDRHRRRHLVIGRKPCMEDTVGHQLTNHRPDVLELLGWQKIPKPVQGMARGCDDLGLGGESQTDLSFHHSATIKSQGALGKHNNYPQSCSITRHMAVQVL